MERNYKLKKFHNH